MDYPLDPTKEIIKWGPTPLYPTVRYHTCMTGIFVGFPEFYPGYTWPKSLCIADTKRFVWLCEDEEMKACAAKLFVDIMLPKDKREVVRTAWRAALAELNQLEAKIGNDVSSWSNDELVVAWTEFHHLTDNFWAHASVPELSNYGSSDILAAKLTPNVPAEEIPGVLETLCAPVDLSFYQEEEIDLVETTDIAAHQKKYFWLKNSYAHVEVLPVSFFEARKKEVPSNIRQTATDRLVDVQAAKDAVQEKYALPQEIRDIGDSISDGIAWQDTRKKDIWVYLHYEDVLLTEIAKRLRVDKKVLYFAMHTEIPALVSGAMPLDTLTPRFNAMGIVTDGTALILVSAEDTLQYWKAYIDTVADGTITEFKGTIASKGKGPVQGRVKIVLDPHGEVDFKPGEVLVTTMTTPEFIFVMKNAVAILTDTGGLTSHAAIVSRELGVPCLVGTKVATQVLKDGDLVEIDATKGIVKILEKAA